jgi:transcriptional regulator with XRE-family HTH domain
MQTLGDMLRTLREERSLKQCEVANALGVSNKILSSYERGISQPPIGMLKKICAFYDVSSDKLLGLDDLSPSAAAKSETSAVPGLEPEDRRVLGYYHRLDEESREAIRGMMICYCREQERKI